MGRKDTGRARLRKKRYGAGLPAPSLARVLRPDDRIPGPHEVVDDNGRVVIRVELVDRADWLQAELEWADPDTPLTALATLVARDLTGIRVATTSAPLAEALVAAGGHVTRRGTQLEYDVRRAPPLAGWLDRGLRDGVRLVDYPVIDERIAAAWLAAYPPGHPDREASMVTVADSIADLTPLRNGHATGPFSDASALAVDASGDVLGGILVTVMPPNPLWSGPWVPDLFVVEASQRRGVGTRLLRYSVAAVAAAGFEGIALAVSDGNPARSVYANVGFRPGPSFTTVAMP